jgi:transposase
LRAVVQEAPVVHTDDTGWRIGGTPAHLLAFETDLATVYQIRPHHRHEEVQEIIPADDGGVMVTDRGRSDEAQAFDRVEQQKCLAHILRSLHDVVERKRGWAREFGASLKAVRQDALALWHHHRHEPVADFKTEAEALQAELTYQLRDRRLKDPDHQRWLNELGWHHDRGNLLRFLAEPRIEPTNNRAERALRPAVIARKVSHGSKHSAGAYAFAAITSVVRTVATQGVDSMVETLSQLFRCPDVQATPP